MILINLFRLKITYVNMTINIITTLIIDAIYHFNYYHCYTMRKIKYCKSNKTDTQTCFDSPCKNGAECVPSAKVMHRNGHMFQCTCPVGYEGWLCQS